MNNFSFFISQYNQYQLFSLIRISNLIKIPIKIQLISTIFLSFCLHLFLFSYLFLYFFFTFLIFYQVGTIVRRILIILEYSRVSVYNETKRHEEYKPVEMKWNSYLWSAHAYVTGILSNFIWVGVNANSRKYASKWWISDGMACSGEPCTTTRFYWPNFYPKIILSRKEQTGINHLRQNRTVTIIHVSRIDFI